MRGHLLPSRTFVSLPCQLDLSKKPVNALKGYHPKKGSSRTLVANTTEICELSFLVIFWNCLKCLSGCVIVGIAQNYNAEEIKLIMLKSVDKVNSSTKLLICRHSFFKQNKNIASIINRHKRIDTKNLIKTRRNSNSTKEQRNKYINVPH